MYFIWFSIIYRKIKGFCFNRREHRMQQVASKNQVLCKVNLLLWPRVFKDVTRPSRNDSSEHCKRQNNDTKLERNRPAETSQQNAS